MNKKTIGIMGCLTSSSNMGCVALTYTLLKLIEKVCLENKCRYIIFDSEYKEERVKKMCEQLGIDRRRIEMSDLGRFESYNIKKILRHFLSFKKNRKMVKEIKKCDVVIDLTGGDSFSDIYGKDRFYYLSSIKRKVEKLGVPLVLGPQTYGPFIDKKCEKYAKRIIENAKIVISRDKESKTSIESFCDVDVKVATDLAFGLPYKKNSVSSQKVLVGFNISGLLHSNKSEDTSLSYKLSSNYDEYTMAMVDYLSNNPKYELHLIPHVGNDANEVFKDNRNLIIHDAFDTPIEAKSCIASMDIFIGSRMHATIGALSSSVVTIPVAYSRKFRGLFNNVEYPFIVDLQAMSTGDAVRLTIEYLNDYDNMKKRVEASKRIIDEKYTIIEKEMGEILE